MREPGAHVLIADDDPVIVRLLELNLRLAGFRVSTATRGDTAVERALELRPDVIVIDVNMPGIDGYEACSRLRREHGMTQMPIVMLTAHAPDDDAARAADVGVTAYVTKPFDPESLVAVVRSALVNEATP
jgi:DNA-binding response OmpR family regulator